MNRRRLIKLLGIVALAPSLAFRTKFTQPKIEYLDSDTVFGVECCGMRIDFAVRFAETVVNPDYYATVNLVGSQSESRDLVAIKLKLVPEIHS